MHQPFALRGTHHCPGARVSIVIPCHNAINTTMLCLTSLIHYSDLPFELIMVNDGSTDATAVSLNHLAVNFNAGHPRITRMQVIHNPARTGCAPASNLGIAAATGDILVWINNDMLFGPNWLSPLVDIVTSHPDVGFVGPWPIRPPTWFQDNPVIEFGDYAGTQINPADPFLVSSGAPWVFRRDVLSRIGGFFDPQFQPAYFEDWDLYNRLLSAGLHFGLTRRSMFFHYEGVTCGQLPERVQSYFDNRRRFLAKWPGGGQLPAYLGKSPLEMNLG